MPAVAARERKVRSNKSPSKPPLKLKTWKEVREYYAAHLKPVAFNARGGPVYDIEDIKRLNVLLPDEN